MGGAIKGRQQSALSASGMPTAQAAYIADALEAKRVERPSVEDYRGLRGDYSDTGTLQEAIDDLQTQVPSSTYGAHDLYLPVGEYRIEDTILLKSCGITGENSPNAGVRIVWYGEAGGTLFEKWSTSHAGNLSFGKIEGLNLRGDGPNKPGILLDLSKNSGVIDVLFQVQRMHFNVASDVLVKLGKWTNLHWGNIRFDGGDNYAIEFAPNSSQSLASFVIDRFTYDNNGTGKGFARVNNSEEAPNTGPILFKGGRIELNGDWSGEKAAFIVKTPMASGLVRSAPIFVEEVTFAHGSTSGNSVFYRDAGGADGTEIFGWKNLFFNSTSAWTMIDGDVGTTQPLPPTRNYHSGFSSPAANLGSYTPVILTANLPAAAAGMDGSVIIEDAGSGDRNLVAYAGGQRFRIDGGTAF